MAYPEGWEVKRLEECCIILDNKRKPVSGSVRVAGKYPYYGANGILDYVSSYIFDGVYVLVGEDGSVITLLEMAQSSPNKELAAFLKGMKAGEEKGGK